MLIFTRKVGETIYVGEDIEITIMDTQGYQVRIGVNAPKDIPVHREEVYHRMVEDGTIISTKKSERLLTV